MFLLYITCTALEAMMACISTIKASQINRGEQDAKVSRKQAVRQ
jgi:hypothetical protein